MICGVDIYSPISLLLSIGNSIIKNKQLSFQPNNTDSQTCDAPGCRQCPLVNDIKRLTVNGKSLTIPRHLNCKSKRVIYLWICKLCNEPYFGRTVQESHNRASGHKSCFNNEEKWEKSALSMHAKECYQNNFCLETFGISVIKKVSPQQLRREEFKHIDKYNSASLGLNRYKRFS